LRGIDRHLEHPTGSPISKLLLVSLPLIWIQLHWIPGNEKQIRIWEDKILNNPPLELNDSWLQLRGWLSANNKITLYDISKWSTCGN
jgi:hypothetical protein